MAAIAEGACTSRYAGCRHFQPEHHAARPNVHPCDRGRRRVPRDDGDACSGARRCGDRASHRRRGARAGERSDQFARAFFQYASRCDHCRGSPSRVAPNRPAPSVRAGGLMSYWVDMLELHAQRASYIDRILRGASPADLPVQRPTKYSLIINLKTAKALGLTVPPTMLDLADEVIE